MGYAKLFSSIVHSTIWQEKPHTKICWITMLAMADQYGQVQASIPGLASAAGISLEQCLESLSVLMAPDPYSRTKEYEGRRILEVDGGWALLNYPKYRAMKSEEEAREKNRIKVARWREKKKVTVTEVGNCIPYVTTSNDKAEAEAEVHKDKSTSPSAQLAKSSAEKPKKEKPKKDPAWSKPFPEDVVEVATEILKIWPDPKVDIQPRDDRGVRKPVPEINRPKLAGRLMEIKQEGGDLQVCLAIAQRYVSDYRASDRVWMKAPQHFFGVRGPWTDLYQAHVTNEQTLELEEVVSNG